MLGKVTSSVEQTIYQLGVWYSGYRLIIAISLMLIYLLTAEQLSNEFEQPFLYFLPSFVILPLAFSSYFCSNIYHLKRQNN